MNVCMPFRSLVISAVGFLAVAGAATQALDAAKLSENEYRWVEVGTLKPDYWTHLRMSGTGPGVILDGIRIEKK